MDFQKIQAIEKPQFYLDVAFKRATKRADQVRSQIKGQPAIIKSRRIESERILTAKKSS